MANPTAARQVDLDFNNSGSIEVPTTTTIDDVIDEIADNFDCEFGDVIGYILAFAVNNPELMAQVQLAMEAVYDS